MMSLSVQHRVPSPFSQLLADESGLGIDEEHYDSISHNLDWTNEELEANLKSKDRSLLLDEVLVNLDALESLSDVEIDFETATEVDILSQPAWSDSKVHPIGVNLQYGQQSSVLPLAQGSFDHGAYTPPQTPPYEEQLQYQPGVAISIANMQVQTVAGAANQQQVIGCYIPAEQDLVIPLELSAYDNSPTDVAHELAVVEDLVRRRANSFLSSSPAPSSPTTSWMSPSSSNSSGESSDFDWSASEPSPKKATQRGRKRAKPYATSDQLEKRSRKKEQNKNAATRYRMKKKAEVAEIQSEENDLEQVKVGHEAKIVDLEREIKLMKGLMREFFLKQGLIH